MDNGIIVPETLGIWEGICVEVADTYQTFLDVYFVWQIVPERA
jgi:hypothetical protein